MKGEHGLHNCVYTSDLRRAADKEATILAHVLGQQ